MLKDKVTIATAIAILFHAIGFVGMFFNKDFFVATTPLNLLLMFGLILYTQNKINTHLVIFFVVCFVVGIWVEVIGTSTGLLFGNYSYSKNLGPAFKNVPLVIGINWCIIMYCCGATVHFIFKKLSERVQEITGSATSNALQLFSVVTDAALLAVFFDFVMETAAIQLGYWEWLDDGSVPAYNYMCWFIISAVLQLLFGLLKFDKQNKFAVHLLMIMSLFFLLIRTFL
jgi:bisanhydrobacterioruberin hydratase